MRPALCVGRTMYRLYKICGFIVGCDFRCPTMTARAEKFLLEGKAEPDISIPFNSEADLERIMEILDSLKKTE